MILKKSFPGYVIKLLFFSDKGKSKFIYTVRADINLFNITNCSLTPVLTQVKMMLFFN